MTYEVVLFLMVFRYHGLQVKTLEINEKPISL